MSLSPKSSARSITFDSLWPEQPGICRLPTAHELFVLVVPWQSRPQSLRCPCAVPAFLARALGTRLSARGICSCGFYQKRMRICWSNYAQPPSWRFTERKDGRKIEFDDSMIYSHIWVIWAFHRKRRFLRRARWVVYLQGNQKNGSPSSCIFISEHHGSWKRAIHVVCDIFSLLCGFYFVRVYFLEGRFYPARIGSGSTYA